MESKILAGIMLMVLFISSVSAQWVMPVDCDKLADKEVLSKTEFEELEKVCFYGSGYNDASSITMTLDGDEDYSEEFETDNGVLSSIVNGASQFFSNVANGVYRMIVSVSGSGVSVSDDEGRSIEYTEDIVVGSSDNDGDDDAEVPEFTTIAAGAALIGAALIINRRKNKGLPTMAMIGLLSLVMVSGVFADSENVVKCVNQDGASYCLPTDETCVYTQVLPIGGEIKEGLADFDADSDSWTDSCDAFPEDGTEWFDMDGDGCGSNKDNDDFDSTDIDGCDGFDDPICIDTDGGINYTKKGYVTKNNHVAKFWDYCKNEDELIETYCGDGWIREETVTCEFGCLDGACVLEEEDNDSDGDGVVDVLDNCPDVENPGQEDADGDGIGDACDDTDDSVVVEDVIPQSSSSSGSSRKQKVCLPFWECSDYGECSEDGFKHRVCTDLNDCDSEFEKPSEKKYCLEVEYLSTKAEEDIGSDSVPVKDEDTEPVMDENSDSEEEEESDLSSIKGKVISLVGGEGNLFILLFAFGAVLMFYLISKRKHDQKKPTTV